MPWRDIVALGGDIDRDVRTLLGDQAAAFRRHPVPVWKLRRLVAEWVAHYGLGDAARLVALLERYGTAIEADLADRQWDLARLWRKRRWRFLLNLVEQLPAASRTMLAMADDDDLIASLPEPEPGPPPLASWTPEVEHLALIADRIGDLIAAVHNTVAKKPARPPRPLPRPQTARDRIRQQRRRARHQLIKDRLTAARTAGRPSMADAAHAADATHTGIRPRHRGGTS
ncbi:hypothetical protein [Streptomyces sp. PTD5-9]|uniref:hypothetical protein n=1 Tax=Streptomyces sp. PTD5-9 TaxID=3120150 RepID=UPI00300851E5